MLVSPDGAIFPCVQRLFPTGFPCITPWVATCCSVRLPALASASKSVLLSRRSPGTVTHNQGPSIFGPPVGTPGLKAREIVVVSDNPAKGEKSDIELW